MARGIIKHLKRMYAPKQWMLDKLRGRWAPKPNAGPHKLRECLPLIVMLRQRLKYALTYREVKMIVMQRFIKVDGKVRSDMFYPAGFMDVVQIEKTKENFRLLYNTKGRFILHKVAKEEANYKLCRVKKVMRGPRGVPYAVTHDGRTIRYPDPDVKAHDTVRLDLETGKILDHVKFEPGNVVMISGGNNIGRVGVITHEEKHPGSFEMVHVKDAVGHSFNTRLENVFVIGQGNKPWISLPKGNGIKLSIVEDSGLHLHHFQGRPDWVSSEPLEHKYSDWWKVEDYSNWSRHHRNDLCSGGTHLDEDLPAGFYAICDTEHRWAAISCGFDGFAACALNYTACYKELVFNDDTFYMLDRPVPQMLQVSCYQGDFDAMLYQRCAGRTSFVNTCNARAIQCRSSYVARSLFDMIFFAYLLLPSCALFALLLVSCFRAWRSRECLLTDTQECRELRKTIRRRAKQLEQDMQQRNATWTERARAFFRLLMFCGDLASDGLCLVFSIVTKQYAFAVCQGILIFLTVISELLKGGPREFLEAFRDFSKTGTPTDKYLSILQAEQGLEAPLSFLLQFYSVFFTANEGAFLTLCVSICMSIYGISKGVYENLHLNLEAAFDEVEELADSEGSSPSRTPVSHPPRMLGFDADATESAASVLPPPPGLKPTVAAAPSAPPPPGLSNGMAAAIAQPAAPVGPVQLGAFAKDTE